MDGQPHSTMLLQLRRAFAEGHAAQGEHLLVSALDAGVPWDQATRAVAEGVATRYSPPAADRHAGGLSLS